MTTQAYHSHSPNREALASATSATHLPHYPGEWSGVHSINLVTDAERFQ